MKNRIEEIRETLNSLCGTCWSYEAGTVPYGTKLVISLMAQNLSDEEILHELREELRLRLTNAEANAALHLRYVAKGKIMHKHNPDAYDENGRRIRVSRRA